MQEKVDLLDQSFQRNHLPKLSILWLFFFNKWQQSAIDTPQNIPFFD